MPQPIPLKVAFLDHTAKLGGGEIALANLLGQLVADGSSDIHPHVMLFEDGPLLNRLHSVGVDATIFPLSAATAGARKDSLGLSSLALVPASVVFIHRLRKHLRHEQFDLVYCNSLKSDVLGGIAARLAGISCIWHVRDRIESDYLSGKVVSVFRRLARMLPTAVVANSRHTLETVQLSEKTPTEIIFSGVVMPSIRRPEFVEPPNLTLIGRLAPWKGQHVFLDAAAVVRRAMPEARFRIVGSAMFGEDDYEQSLREQVDRLGLGEVIEFRGFRDDVWAELAESTLVVHASTSPEPFGQVVVEAMAACRAVVASDAGGVRETVVHGETGLLFEPGNADAMADAMIQLLADPDRRRTMAEAGRRRVAEHFTIDQTAATVSGFLHRIADLNASQGMTRISRTETVSK